MQPKYKITQNSYNEIQKYDWIRDHIRLGLVGTSDPREMIRLLEKGRSPSIQKLLCLVNMYGEQSDDIGKRLLECKDRMAFPGRLAEMYVFAHLKKNYVGNVNAIRSIYNKHVHDIDIEVANQKLKLEIYTPYDFYAYKVFYDLLWSLVENLPVNFRFSLSITTNTSDPYYPINFPKGKKVYIWFNNLENTLIKWLQNAHLKDVYIVKSPCKGLEVRFELIDKLNNSNINIVSLNPSGMSIDTKLLFEPSDVVSSIKQQWAGKVKLKLEKLQAGPTEDYLIRILLLNFSTAETGDFGFLKEQNYFSNIERMIKILASKIEPYPPYDAVIPCVLGLTCGFASPIILSQNMEDKIASLLPIVHLNDPIRDVPLLNSANIIVISND